MGEEKPERQQGLLKILASVFSGVLFGLFLSKFDSPTEKTRKLEHPQETRAQEGQGSPASPRESVIHNPVNPNQSQDGHKHNTPFSEKAADVVALGLLVVNLGLLVVNYFQMNATKRAAEAAKNSAEWTTNQTRLIFNDQRPLIWVKMPKMRVEAGKPIHLANVENFNYGRTPGLARAHIRFEAAQGVIEKFRDTLRDHPEEFSMPDNRGVQKVLIPPGESRDFPIETPEITLTRQDMNKMVAGTMDVTIYGRIFYSDMYNRALGVPYSEYNSCFCFYLLKDGTTSACPNKKGAYTNFAP